MTTIQTYLYDNRVEVQFWDPTIFTTRNREVYTRTVRIYQGIDNSLQFQAKNQDQKPVNLTGMMVQAQIQNSVNQVTVAQVPVVMANIALGRGTLTITRELANSLTQRRYHLTFKTINLVTNVERPLYGDHNWTVPIELVVEDAYYSNSLPGLDEGGILIDGGTI
jgi:hypothetical protein